MLFFVLAISHTLCPFSSPGVRHDHVKLHADKSSIDGCLEKNKKKKEKAEKRKRDKVKEMQKEKTPDDSSLSETNSKKRKRQSSNLKKRSQDSEDDIANGSSDSEEETHSKKRRRESKRKAALKKTKGQETRENDTVHLYNKRDEMKEKQEGKGKTTSDNGSYKSQRCTTEKGIPSKADEARPDSK